ncbi:MAG: GAF domain-containing protein [Chloroflexi bacterium]|nr:GAF domain-containing protein [Chloroflexota bacterium]
MTTVTLNARLVALQKLMTELACQSVSQQILLDSLAQFCVDNLDAAFARIWLVNETEDVLILQASRGQYTRINGTRARISIGQGSKIDKLYVAGKPHITNDVLNDPGVKDKEWAQREAFVAFAGYPLIWGCQPLGVLGMYSRQTLSEDLLLLLSIFCAMASATIYQQRQTEHNMMQFCQVTGFKRVLLDRLIALGDDKVTVAPRVRD